MTHAPLAVGAVGLMVAMVLACGSDPALGAASVGSETSGPGDSDETTSGSSSSSMTDDTIEPTTLTDTTGLDDTDEIEPNCNDGVLAAGDLCFGDIHPLDSRPTGVLAVGDLDGDEHLDVVAGQVDGLRVYFGRGDGEFEDEFDIPTDSGVLGLAVADFDADGIDDVAFADSSSDRIGLILGGTRFPAALAALDVDGFPRGLFAGDLDGDGDVDLLVTSEDTAQLTMVLGDGLGGLTFGQILNTGSTPVAVTVGSIGGTLHAWVANFGGATVSAYRREGPGFVALPSLDAQLGGRGLAFADIDGDGNNDLVSIHQSGASVGLWRGSNDALGPPSFRAAGGQPRAIVTSDFDDDGHTDVAYTLENTGHIGIMRGTPVGLSQARVFPVLTRPDAIGSGDFDEDGVIDLVVGSSASDGGIVVLVAAP